MHRFQHRYSKAGSPSKTFENTQERETGGLSDTVLAMDRVNEQASRFAAAERHVRSRSLRCGRQEQKFLEIRN